MTVYRNQAAKLVYFLCSVLWFIILLPKELQLIVYLFAIIYWCFFKHRRILIDSISKMFILFSFAHLCSIFINFIIGDHDNYRVFAALNTCFIWLIAILIFSIVQKVTIEINNLGKIFFRNITIMFLVYLLYYLTNITYIDYIFDSRFLKKSDWLNGVLTYRFTGFMEYDTLVAIFIILQFPIAYLSMKKNSSRFILCVFSVIPVIACSSRMGILCMVLEVLSILISTKYIRKNKFIFIISGSIVLTISLFVLKDKIIETIVFILASRQGSTSMRANIIIVSLKKVLYENIFLGIGIKDMLLCYPLGSHCTYVGIFYKSGMIGSCLWICGIIRLTKKEIFNLSSKNFFLIFNIFIFYFMLLTEDLDGANWLIVTFFIIHGSYIASFQGARCKNHLEYLGDEM